MTAVLCQCGCGKPTPIAKRNNTAKGHVKGEPLRFRHGHGAKPPGPAPRIPFAERYEKYVTIGDPDSCWLWTGAGGTYGHVKVNNRQVGAHVATYELFHGQVPAGFVVRHTCDVPRCCNPNHLLVGTYADNTRDAVERDRFPRGERSPHSRLTTEDVRRIRALRDNGLRISQIVTSTGLPRHLVRAVVEHRSWVRS